MAFESGDKVEVCSKLSGYQGSYFEGTVVAKKGTNYVVQYKTLVEEYDESIPLRESVMADEVRPRPPKITDESSEFHIGNRVDAYDLDGWWVGAVSSEKNVYGFQYVFFETCQEEKAYPVRKLRFHQEWSNGKWDIRSSKKRKKTVFF